MPMTAAPKGVIIGTGATIIITNPSNSNEIRTYEIALVNYNGATDVDISSCQFVDALDNGAASGVAYHILPTNYTLKAKVGLVAFTKVLEPGDVVRATASAATSIQATADMVWVEPVTA